METELNYRSGLGPTFRRFHCTSSALDCYLGIQRSPGSGRTIERAGEKYSINLAGDERLSLQRWWGQRYRPNCFLRPSEGRGFNYRRTQGSALFMPGLAPRQRAILARHKDSPRSLSYFSLHFLQIFFSFLLSTIVRDLYELSDIVIILSWSSPTTLLSCLYSHQDLV